jgi:hypothetical protein
LLHDTPAETRSADLSQVWRQATADRLPSEGRVRVRQAGSVRAASPSDEHRQALREQADLLTQLRGRAMLPVLVDLVDDARSTTLVTSHPAGRLWQDVFGPGPTALDRLSATGVLAAGADACVALTQLHHRGQQHRELSPHAVVVSPEGRGRLRDLGLACIPASRGDGQPIYRAPEQVRAPHQAGAPTDLFQLAALIYHTLTGHPPAPLPPPPVRLSLPEFPSKLDDLIIQALDGDPRGRPPDLEPVAAALRAGNRELSRVGPW